ncbi:hypothetical protein TL16_g08445 [Triparma laevis f. inornata]|uniref:Uncharacterized protein n=1 Tax=Triparma laevis f. inornata TaxID=1714386 RepID=A0A9W7B284_9STRA|nr:hypothetical protein TL16_g08445 [Triparma laevis f. inornata]
MKVTEQVASNTLDMAAKHTPSNAGFNYYSKMNEGMTMDFNKPEELSKREKDLAKRATESALELGLERAVLEHRGLTAESAGDLSSTMANVFRLHQFDREDSQRINKHAQALYENIISFNNPNHNATKAPPPGLLISVAGDNGDPPLLRPIYMQHLGRDLKKLCELTGAWVIATGGDNGVSRLFGELRHRNSIRAPFIGFCSSETTAGTKASELVFPPVKHKKHQALKYPGLPEELVSKVEEKPIEYPPPGHDIKNYEVILHPDYTHIVIVEHDYAFERDEVESRVTFEDFVCRQQFVASHLEEANTDMTNIPRVQLVYGGGKETIDICHHVAQNKIPLILVQHSGGFVQVARELMTINSLEGGGSDGGRERERLMKLYEEHLRKILRDEHEDGREPTQAEFQDADKKMKAITELHKTGANRIYLYCITEELEMGTEYKGSSLTFNEQEDDTVKLVVDEVHHGDLTEICTSALLESNSLSTRSKLFLSIKWNNPLNSRRIMDQMPLDSRKLPASVQLAYTGEALAHAAMNNHAGVMQVLYDNGLKNKFLDIMITLDLGYRFTDRVKIKNLHTFSGASRVVSKFLGNGVKIADIEDDEKSNGITTSVRNNLAKLNHNLINLRSNRSFLLPSSILDSLEGKAKNEHQEGAMIDKDGWVSIYDYYDTYKNATDEDEDVELSEEGQKKQDVEREFIGNCLYIELDSKSRIESFEEYPYVLKDRMQKAFGHQYLSNHGKMIKVVEQKEADKVKHITHRDLVYRTHGFASECHLTYMHRAYWAVLIDAFDAARVFMKRCPAKIATCLLLSRTLRLRAENDTIRCELLLSEADWYDEEMVSSLDEMMNTGTAETHTNFMQMHLFNLEHEEADILGVGEEKKDKKFYTWAENNHYTNAFKLFEEGTDGPQTIIDLALLTDNKKFTSHDIVQKFLDDVWKRRAGQPDEWEDHRDGHFIRVPVSPRRKMVIQTTVFLLFMVMYSWLVFTGVKQRCDITTVLSTNQETLFWSFCIGFAWEEIQAITRDGWQGYFAGNHNFHDFSLVVSWGAALFIRFIVWLNMDSSVGWVRVGNSTTFDDGGGTVDETCPVIKGTLERSVTLATLGSQIILSIAYFIASLRLLEIMSIYETVGILMIMLKKMWLNDCVPYFTVSLVLLFMMSTAMYGVFGVPDSYITWINNALSMFFVGGDWEMFSQGVDTQLKVDEETGTLPEEWSWEDMIRYSFGSIGFYIFVIITNIILVNLLIAQMSDTYATVKENSGSEWKHIRTSIVKDMYHSSLLPPPFNVINSFGSFLRRCTGKTMTDHNRVFLKEWMRWGVPTTDAKGKPYKFSGDE